MPSCLLRLTTAAGPIFLSGRHCLSRFSGLSCHSHPLCQPFPAYPAEPAALPAQPCRAEGSGHTGGPARSPRPRCQPPSCRREAAGAPHGRCCEAVPLYRAPPPCTASPRPPPDSLLPPLPPQLQGQALRLCGPPAAAFPHCRRRPSRSHPPRRRRCAG